MSDDKVFFGPACEKIYSDLPFMLRLTRTGMKTSREADALPNRNS